MVNYSDLPIPSNPENRMILDEAPYLGVGDCGVVGDHNFLGVSLPQSPPEGLSQLRAAAISFNWTFFVSIVAFCNSMAAQIAAIPRSSLPSVWETPPHDDSMALITI